MADEVANQPKLLRSCKKKIPAFCYSKDSALKTHDVFSTPVKPL